LKRDSAVMMSLDHAHCEIFLLGIALIFWNGSTAMEGFVGQSAAAPAVQSRRDWHFESRLRTPIGRVPTCLDGANWAFNVLQR